MILQLMPILLLWLVTTIFLAYYLLPLWRTLTIAASATAFNSWALFYVSNLGTPDGVPLIVGIIAWCIWLVLLGTLFFGAREARGPRLEHENLALFNILFSVAASLVVYAYGYGFDGLECGSASKTPCNDLKSTLYFSVITWTSVGYGDLSPVPAFYLVAASEALLGNLASAIVIGAFLERFLRPFR